MDVLRATYTSGMKEAFEKSLGSYMVPELESPKYPEYPKALARMSERPMMPQKSTFALNLEALHCINMQIC